VQNLSRIALIVAWLALTGLILVGCAGASGGAPAASQPFELAPESALPDFVRNAPPQVREAYRFAIANPEVVQKYPCYCGCGAAGHRSNLDCYIKERHSDGSTIVLDNHAVG
jgi:hypothetical protein